MHVTQEPSPSIWQDRTFRRIFSAQVLAEFGTQISFLAIPVLASTILGATAWQMGLLTAANALPALVLGLHAGVLIDRRAKRPILLATDLARGALVAVIPIAWIGGWLTMDLLVVISLAVGACSLLFHVAYQAFLPTVLQRHTLLTANSTLELSRTAAEIAGPGISGWLIGLVTAPGAMVANAMTYLGSAWVLRGLPPDRRPQRDQGSSEQSVWQEVGDGVRILLRDQRLRAITISGATLEFFNAMADTLFVLFVIQTLGLSAATIGIIFTLGSLGFAIGALLPHRLARTLGFGRASMLALLVVGASDLLVPLAHGSTMTIMGMLVIAQVAFGIGLTVFKVNRATVRQVLIPTRMQGRAAATMRVLSASLIPLGALVGGTVGNAIGLRAILIIAAIGELAAALWLLRVPFDDVPT